MFKYAEIVKVFSPKQSGCWIYKFYKLGSVWVVTFYSIRGKMDPIFLYPEENKGKYYISIGRSNDLLSTPGGNLIESHNEALIENLVY